MKAAAIGLLVLFGASGGSAAEPEEERWRQLISEAQAELSRNHGDFDTAMSKLLIALELSESLSPLQRAATLEKLAVALPGSEFERSLEMLERAYAIKEAEVGPRSAEVADTLMMIAGVQDSENHQTILAAEKVGEEPKLRFLEGSKPFATRSKALSIRQEVFGENSCQAGEVRVLLAVHHQVAGDLHRAEQILRDVLVYCPPQVNVKGEIDTERDSVGLSAFASLRALLAGQDRVADLEKLEAEYNR